MNKQRFEHTITRYLKGIAAPEEEKELLTAIRTSDELYATFRERTAAWNPLEEKDAEMDRKWSRVASVISPAEVEENNKNACARTLPLRHATRTRWRAVAAAIVILLLSGVTVYLLRTGDRFLDADQTEWLTIMSPDSDQTHILSDGSSVYLRKGSSFIYPKAFGSSLREVSLQGEAFFDVTHDPERPFIVNTSRLAIKVLGTSFSVEAPTDGETISVTLVQGMVSLNDHHQKELVRLNPNQKADYVVSSGQYTVSEVDSERMTSWRKGIISYDNASLDEIVRLIESAYGVSLHYNQAGDQSQRFSGAFLKAQSLHTVLEQTSKLTGSDLTASQ